MKSRYGKGLIGGVALMLVASAAHSAPWDKSQRLTRVTKSYDVNQVETVTGMVENIHEKTPSNSANPESLGFHMTLRTAHEVLDIHLGPVWYLNKLDGKIDKGDLVQVVGSRAEGHAHKDGTPAMRELRAAEVKKGNDIVLKLRDSDGRPLWSGY